MHAMFSRRSARSVSRASRLTPESTTTTRKSTPRRLASRKISRAWRDAPYDGNDVADANLARAVFGDGSSSLEEFLLLEILEVDQGLAPGFLLARRGLLAHPRQVRLERLDGVAHGDGHRSRGLQMLHHGVDALGQRVRVLGVGGGPEISDDHLQRVKKRDATRATARDGAVGVMRGETSDGGMLRRRRTPPTTSYEQRARPNRRDRKDEGARNDPRGDRRDAPWRARTPPRLARAPLSAPGASTAGRRRTRRRDPPRTRDDARRRDSRTRGRPIFHRRDCYRRDFPTRGLFSPPSPLSAPPVARVVPRG